MNTYIALLRGINVGGHNSLPMKNLVAIMVNLGLENIRTFIQSGNVVFDYSGQDASLLPQKINTEIDQQFRFSPLVIILTLPEFERAVANNPFDHQVSDPRNLHFGFMASKPEQPDLKRMEYLKANSEQFHLTDRVFYLFAPMGIGKSKLAAQVEKLLGVSMTDRNFRTVQKLLEIAHAPNNHTNN